MQYTLRLIVLPARPRFAAVVRSVASLAIWRQRSRTRRHLTRLDARALADVGLTSAQQRAEVAKRFWQP
jgi:uncharacterized protein YjiS (DUF1127 family)